MKKYIIIIFIVLYFLISLLFRRELILTNINYFILSGHTQDNIERALFYFNEEDEISIEEIKSRFPYSDNITFLNQNEFKNRFSDNIISYKSPIFSSDVNQYFFFANIENTTLAGEESLVSVAKYLWFPWGWINIDNYIKAGA